MSSWLERRRAALPLLVLCAGLAAALAAGAGTTYSGIGRSATPRELAAWDIDVRPDLKGLPGGSGTVAQGMVVWEDKCASCHGVFGESNQTFSPLVGGTTAQDIQSGHVARLTDAAFPGRTTLMKVSSVSTLWDYINRAMPWTSPKSLQPDEVYAVTAYLLNLGGIVPDDFTLTERSMADVQKLLPNRHGTTTDHGLWPGQGLGNGGRPDVKAVACMANCAAVVTVASSLPDFARQAHGNLAQQNRSVGAQRGADTSRPAAASAAQARAMTLAAAAVEPGAAAVAGAQRAAAGGRAAVALTRQHNCAACHGVDSQLVGPSFREVARRYGERADAVGYLTGKIRAGGSGLWGALTMPAQTLNEADAKIIAQWLAVGAP
jgi:cytochrome c551/c552/cytochrome c553